MTNSDRIVAPPAYIVYQDHPASGTYHAVTASGSEIAANQNDPQPVLQAALDKAFWNDASSGPKGQFMDKGVGTELIAAV